MFKTDPSKKSVALAESLVVNVPLFSMEWIMSKVVKYLSYQCNIDEYASLRLSWIELPETFCR